MKIFVEIYRKYFLCYKKVAFGVWGLIPEKIKSNRWQGWGGHGISRGIEERENSRGQLKNKWNLNIRRIHKKLIMWNG